MLASLLSAKSLIYNIENAIKEMPDILPANEVDKIKQAIVDLDKTFASNARDVISEKSHLLEKQTEKFVEARLNFAAAELFKGKKID